MTENIHWHYLAILSIVCVAAAVNEFPIFFMFKVTCSSGIFQNVKERYLVLIHLSQQKIYII